MPIIVQDIDVEAEIAFSGQGLDINFIDPTFVRCDSVLVDMLQRTIGVTLHEGFHNLGTLPEAISADSLKDIKTARLSGLVGGETLSLNAPIKLSNV